jgi:hypothetical protein
LNKQVEAVLELESPMFTCGHCHFGTCLSGKWAIEDGRLIFRADADPQPRRGPDLDGCCESWDIAVFTKIVTDTDQEFSLPLPNVKLSEGGYDV